MDSAMTARTDMGTDHSVIVLNKKRTRALSVQKYLKEVCSNIQELKYRREDIDKEISELNEEKKHLQTDIARTTSELSKLNENLFSKAVHIKELNQLEEDYNRHWDKLVEGSEILLRSMSRATIEIERQHTTGTFSTC
jgi:chromosome segregation ATPase